MKFISFFGRQAEAQEQHLQLVSCNNSLQNRIEKLCNLPVVFDSLSWIMVAKMSTIFYFFEVSEVSSFLASLFLLATNRAAALRTCILRRRWFMIGPKSV